jgi:hypothetical protein
MYPEDKEVYVIDENSLDEGGEGLGQWIVGLIFVAATLIMSYAIVLWLCILVPDGCIM